MLISELQAVLDRAKQYAGDVEVILKDIETGAETAIHEIIPAVDALAGGAGGKVTLTHAVAPQAAPQGAPPADAAPAAGQ